MLNLYRKTLKRVRPIHALLHRITERGVIPALEGVRRFETVPDDPFWFRLELLTGRHEPATIGQIERLLRPGMTVLDVGAHVGYYTRLCAEKAARVVAFEPHPRTYERLLRNVARFDNVIALNAAVAEFEGTAELYDYLMMSASGSLHYDESLRETQMAGVGEGDIAPRLDFPMQTFTVRTVAIDAVLAEHGIERVDLVKMDIEGAEIGALRGMRRTIAHSPGMALIMEYNPMALKAFGHDPAAALEEVRGLGFSRVQIIDDGLRDLDPPALPDLTARLERHMDVVNLLLTV